MSDSEKKPAPAKAEKKKLSLMPIMMGVVIVLVLAIGAKVFFGGFKANAKNAGAKKPPEVGISLQMDEFLVNLNGSSDHYLKTTLALGMKKGLTEEQVKEHVPAMRDAILGVLQTKNMKELNSAKEREALKDEIKEHVNKEVEHEPVVKVYCTAFATQ